MFIDHQTGSKASFTQRDQTAIKPLVTMGMEAVLMDCGTEYSRTKQEQVVTHTSSTSCSSVIILSCRASSFPVTLIVTNIVTRGVVIINRLTSVQPPNMVRTRVWPSTKMVTDPSATG